MSEVFFPGKAVSDEAVIEIVAKKCNDLDHGFAVHNHSFTAKTKNPLGISLIT